MDYKPHLNLLQGRTILVTGAGDGIGRSAALAYARYGAEVILLGRTPDKLSHTAEAILAQGGRPARVLPCDLLTATQSEYQDLACELADTIPCLHGVLHNAGLLGEVVPMAQQDPLLWQQVMQVNVNGTFMLTQALLPLLLRAPDASLIFTSSSVGRIGRSGWGAYAVSKFATEGMMQVLAQEYQGTSLRVNCINPGGTRTAMRASAFPNEDPARLKTPEDIMPLYVYLMGPDSAHCHGSSLDAQPNRTPGPAT